MGIEVNKVIKLTFQVENPHHVHAGCFYYNAKGDGYLKKSFTYKNNSVTVVLREDYIQSLRFDPMESENFIIIKNITINGISAESTGMLVLKPLHAIKSIEKIRDRTYKIASSGDDPYLLLANNIASTYDWRNLKLNYAVVFMGFLLLLLAYFDVFSFSKVKSFDTNKTKEFMLIYLSAFFSLVVIVFSVKLNFIFSDVNIFSKALVFDGFVVEFVMTYVLLFVLLNKYKISFFLGSCVFLTYISINISQLISLVISGEFLSKLALDNIEFIGLMLNLENITTVAVVLSFMIVGPGLIAYLIVKYSHVSKIMTNFYFLAGLIIVGVFMHFSYKFVGAETLSWRTLILNKSHMQHVSPVQALVKTLKTKSEVNILLTKEEVANINALGFVFSPLKKYPLTKQFIYKAHRFGLRKKPNIIIIFTEGFSARTSSVYNPKFIGLTPNLFAFAKNKNSMVVDNYYNHTAATYRGLLGQLCSLYPKYGGVGGWDDNIKNIPSITYKCLPHILNHNGYDTTWLNVHYRDASGNDEMMEHFGFNHILSAEDLLRRYNGKAIGKRRDFLTDHQSYGVLIDYLKDHDKSTKPFMIGMYTVETHAWIDTPKYGIKYKDGKNNGLNTIHNMDDAFGEFWDFFINSKYAQDTIIVFTSDHAHYYEKSYLETMRKYKEGDYKKVFVDRIPLIIYNPVTRLPNHLKVHSRTSLDFAPTIAQMLDLKNENNVFMGTSLFDKKSSNIGISSIGEDSYLIKNDTVYDEFSIADEDDSILKLAKRFIALVHEFEAKNRLIKDIR